jgi:hypothetical protein
MSTSTGARLLLPPGSMKPDYEGYCLSNVPATVQSLFGLDAGRPRLPKDALGNVETSNVDNVILMLCDGLGYNEWRRNPGTGFFGALSAKGSVRAITSVFPSTTAAALTTVSTGLTPQEHGLPEWFVYMQELGEIIVTLPFTRLGEYGRDTLKGAFPERSLFDGAPIFRKLKGEGIGCMTFTGAYLASTVYSTMTRAGTAVTPYTSASDLSVSLRRFIEGAKGRNFVYVYWSNVDHIEHTYGQGTDEALVETSLISHALQEGFLDRVDREAAKRTLVLLTADHGQIAVEPEKTVYVNRFAKLTKSLQKSPHGEMIPPWGNVRDSYYLVDEDRLEETQGYLQEKLDGVATVMKTADAVKEGLFGINRPSRRFLRRVGNLMVLPHGNKTVFYRYKKGAIPDLKGHHGGLTQDEMTIPFAAARLSDLL